MMPTLKRTTSKTADIDSLLSRMTEDEQTDLFALTAATDYAFYCEYVHKGRYIHGRHTMSICDALTKVESGELKRLMLLVPPRHSKSMTVTETFPSWFIGRKPSRRVIAVSYGESLARRYGRSNLRKIEEFGAEVFGVVPDRGRSAVTNWGVEGYVGGMISTGIGGAVTGEGAELMIIDDPVKNRQEADSLTYRNMVWDEWQSTLLTRLEADSAVIVILTRWHKDDLVGRLLDEYPDDWTVLKYPAIAEEDDMLGRLPGQALWPEKGFDEEWAVVKKKEVGSYAWASLYQQRPSPAEGGILKRDWWNFYRVPPSNFELVLQSWDMSFKDHATNSFVVGQVWGKKRGDVYLLDQVRAQMDFVTTIRAVRTLTGKWPEAKLKLIEDKANGTAVISSLKREIAGIVPVNPSGSKEARAYSVSPQIEAGNVFLPDPSIAPWVHDFVEECAAFPNGSHNDQVDTMTQALSRFESQKAKPAGVWGR